MNWWLLLLGDSQFFEFGGHVGAVGARLHSGVDVEEFAILPDVKSCAPREFPLCIVHAVGLGGFARGIAQDRIVRAQRFGKSFGALLAVYRITTGGEVSDIELADFCAARTERLAFRRSTTGEGFWKPSQDDGFLAFEFREFVRLAVAAGQFEVRRRIAGFQRFAGPSAACAAPEPSR